MAYFLRQMVFGPTWAPLLHRPSPFGRALPCRASGVVRVHFSWFSSRSFCPLLRPLFLRRGLLQSMLAVDEAGGGPVYAPRGNGGRGNNSTLFICKAAGRGKGLISVGAQSLKKKKNYIPDIQL